MKKLFLIGLCLCLMLACAACQGAEQKPAETPSGRNAVESTREAAGSPSELSGTQSESSAAEISNAPSTATAPVSPSTTHHAAQAVALLSAKQAGAIDCIVYQAGPDAIYRIVGKTYQLQTEEMKPVLDAVRQQVWRPTGDTWELKTSPDYPEYVLFFKTGEEEKLELRLCHTDGSKSGFIAVIEGGKMTRYEVPFATYQQLLKAHTFT